MAVTTAVDCTCPSLLHLTWVASSNRYGTVISPRSRDASSPTWASIDLHIALTWSFESLSMPIFRSIRSIFLLETPLAYDSATAATTARSALK